MPIKANIFKGVLRVAIRKRVPPAFQAVVNETRLAEGPYTLLCFPAMKNESTFIVDSKVLKKNLQKVGGNTEQLVIIAHGFTEEAQGVLQLRNAIVFFKSDFHWTDESWANIRDKR